ncbi:unnamed protein product [Penicillium pancosmium]
MNISTSPAEPLADIGKLINAGFLNLEKSDTQSDSTRIAILNEQQRFQLWARNLGLYHRGHSSLDYRFRDSSFLFEYAFGLLRDLQKAIFEFKPNLMEDKHCIETENTSNTAFQSKDNDSMNESDSEEDLSSYEVEPMSIVLLHTIISIIDRLYRLAFKVRNPSIRLGFQRFPRAGIASSQADINLIECFRDLDVARISDLFLSYRSNQDIAPCNYLIQRLAKANAYRRQQFEYWKHRRDQFEAQSNFELLGISTTMSQPATATVLETDEIDLNDDYSTKPSTTSILSASEGSSQHIIIPRPPPLENGAKEFECPYCYTLLSSNTQRKSKWELHIYRDLRPYICTFENCKDPDQQYDSLQDWMVHEASEHNNTSQLSSALRFHLKPGSSRAVGKNAAGLSARECAFCEKENASAAHVALHLRRIALFALPRLSIDDSQDEGSLQESQGAAINLGSSRSSLPHITGGRRDALVPLPISSHEEIDENWRLGKSPEERFAQQPGSGIGSTSGSLSLNPSPNLSMSQQGIESQPYTDQMAVLRPRSFRDSDHDIDAYIPDLEEETRVLQLERQGGMEITQQGETDNKGNAEEKIEINQSKHRGMHLPSASSPQNGTNSSPETIFQYLGAWTGSTGSHAVWYCCHCNFGPHKSTLYEACINCGQNRCAHCIDEEI